MNKAVRRLTVLTILLGIGVLGGASVSLATSYTDVDPHYKFSGVQALASPYKNTWSDFQTDMFTGAFTYNYKIVTPPGTNGLTPQVTINYNNQSAKGKAGWVGSGWEVPQSYIQRDIQYTRTDTSDDTFDLYLDGTKYTLVWVASDGRYHTKLESFLKIDQVTGAPNEQGQYWVVTDKSGKQYRFGYNTDSENMLNTTDTSFTKYVWRWSLDQIKDTNGNTITYQSKKPVRCTLLPSRIIMTENGPFSFCTMKSRTGTRTATSLLTRVPKCGRQSGLVRFRLR